MRKVRDAGDKKPMRQWVLRITDYAERLLEDMNELKDWPEHIKESQRNWIGKSEGTAVKFKLFADERFFSVLGSPRAKLGARHSKIFHRLRVR